MKFKWINPKYALVRVKDDMAIVKDDGTGVLKYTIHASPDIEESYDGGKYLIEQIGEVVASENSLLKQGDRVWMEFTWFKYAKQDGLVTSTGDGFIEALVPVNSIICKWVDGRPAAIRQEIIVKQDERPPVSTWLWMSGNEMKKLIDNQVYGTVMSIGDQSQYGGWFEAGKRVLYSPAMSMKIEHEGETWHRVKMADVLLKEVPDA